MAGIVDKAVFGSFSYRKDTVPTATTWPSIFSRGRGSRTEALRFAVGRVLAGEKSPIALSVAIKTHVHIEH